MSDTQLGWACCCATSMLFFGMENEAISGDKRFAE
jgi:hypothetical protein